MLTRVVDAALRRAGSTEWFGRIVRNAVKEEVDSRRLAVVVQVEEGDILVFPSDMDDLAFESLTRMIPESSRLGIVSADTIKILRFQ